MIKFGVRIRVRIKILALVNLPIQWTLLSGGTHIKTPRALRANDQVGKGKWVGQCLQYQAQGDVKKEIHHSKNSLKLCSFPMVTSLFQSPKNVDHNIRSVTHCQYDNGRTTFYIEPVKYPLSIVIGITTSLILHFSCYRSQQITCLLISLKNSTKLHFFSVIRIFAKIERDAVGLKNVLSGPRVELERTQRKYTVSKYV